MKKRALSNTVPELGETAKILRDASNSAREFDHQLDSSRRLASWIREQLSLLTRSTRPHRAK